MKIDKKDISELKEAPYNPRKISKKMLEKLKDSIANFGYVDPLIWNQRTGHVVGGNQRLKVLKELGFKDVDVIVVDFPLEQEKALNIALNKISGDWEMDKLIELLEGLTDNLRLLAGFTEKEIEDLLNDLENNPYTMKVSKYNMSR
jgi:ParB-like chromosome segregation protein Spo0J